MGVLVQLRGTQVYRVALLPIDGVVCHGGRASQSIPREEILREHSCTPVHVLLMFTEAVWFLMESFHPNLKGVQDKADPGSIATALWNAWDLLLNVRGIGWNWSRGLILPKPAFEIRSRTAFVLWSAVRFAFHFLAFDAIVQVFRMISPEGLASPTGASIYDPSLPPVWQLLRCVAISTLVMLMACFGMELCHILLAILFVTVFQQHPSQWPPLFDSPWLSTSVSDFWGRRWHQMIRHTLLMVAGRPFNVLFGRLGESVGRGGNFFIVVGFFVMNGVGVVLERVWKRVSGRSVGGIWGWMWTFSWMTLWAVPLVDEWGKVGRFGANITAMLGYKGYKARWLWVQLLRLGRSSPERSSLFRRGNCE
ncbi:hypothetical protein BU15DRAFT_63360 [Melanogaster broomeanus]|nr:hypothetical protein BU15DRAFT_63360 [Melanogaster broomeanus]